MDLKFNSSIFQLKMRNVCLRLRRYKTSCW